MTATTLSAALVPTAPVFSNTERLALAGFPTVTRRLCIVAGFYRYAVEEELLSHSPAAHVRRPRLDYESRATGLDRNELGALWSPPGSARPPSMH